MKAFQLLFVSFLLLFPHVSLSQCSTPLINNLNNISYNNVQVNYTCCQAGTYYLEYGLNGFTPGTTTSAGTGGTVVQVQSNPGNHVMSGLTPNTLYDVYVRIFCNTGVWTSNSSPGYLFRTAQICQIGQAIVCGNDYQVVLPSGMGAWDDFVCSLPGSFALGREKLYKYTAGITGIHNFYAGTSSGNLNRVQFSYKSDSLPCNETNWICLTTAPTGTPITFSFGPLEAGKTYYFRADAQYSTIPPDTASFRIECPTATCNPPSNVSITGVSPEEIKVEFIGGVNTVFEYGPPGFTPGAANMPGNNGTMQYINSGDFIDNLTPGTFMHGYLRSYCNVNGTVYYSANAGPYGFSVAQCPVPWILDPVIGPLDFEFNYPWSNLNQYNGVCYPSGGIGDDARVIFTAPKTAHYKATFDFWPYYFEDFSMKPYDTVCVPSAYTCMQATLSGNNSAFVPLGTLDKDSTYDFILDCWDTTEISISFNIECSGPEDVSSIVTPFSADISWTCDCIDTVFLEIGPKDFTPGSGYTPGTNGTLVFTTDTTYSFTNLTPFTEYDIYLRSSCVTFFSPNRKITVFTPKNCVQAPVVNCSDSIDFHYNATWWFEPLGAWNLPVCSGSVETEEYIYRFTPDQSGMHQIYVHNVNSNWTNTQLTAKYFYKHDSLGCDTSDWNCIGQVSSTLNNFTPQLLTFGPLTAGETYYILTDGVYNTYHWFHYYGLLVCPGAGVCGGPMPFMIFPINPDGISIYAICASCDSNAIVEIGPEGFTPGTDTLPGVNGIVYQNVTFPYLISGLPSGITYDIYLRADCSNDTIGYTSGFSNNSGPFSITLCSTPPDSITTSANDTIICQGEFITLYRTGGVPAPGTTYRWYVGGCGAGSVIGQGDSIQVSPNQTTTYFVRSEGSCGNSSCASRQIQVSSSPPLITGNTSLCPGDTTTLGTLNTYSQYLWSNGDITPTTIISAPGFYTVTVTNDDGCQVSNDILVTAIPFTPPQIFGNPDLCPGDSTTLFAASGYTSYLWSDGSTGSSITVSDSGTYAVTVTNQFGCSGSTSVQVNIHPYPVTTIFGPSDLTFCVGDSILLSAAPGPTGWEWYRNNVLINGSTGPQLWIKTAGNYFCIGFNSIECADTSNVLTAVTPCIQIGPPDEKILSDPTGSDFFDAMILSNPSIEQPVIRILCNGRDPVNLEAFDCMGRKVIASADWIQEQDYRLTIQGMSGMYLIQVHCGKKIRNLKLMKL